MPKLDNITILMDGRLNTKNAAQYLDLAVKTLAMHRCNGTGPAFIKRGKIFYYRDDLDAWLQSARATSTAQANASEKRNA